MRRDEGLLTTHDEAVQWLEMYRHTITDPTVLKVVELLEMNHSEEWDDLQNQIACKEDQIRSLDGCLLCLDFYEHSLRGRDWLEFSGRVLDHIEKYTVPQYGDKGDDQATDYESRDHVKQAKKYLDRYGKNSRPGQEILDLMKTAHYCQMAAMELAKELGVSDATR